MSRWIIAVRGIGLLLAVSLAVMTLRQFVGALSFDGDAVRWSDLVSSACACAAIALLHLLLLASPSSPGGVRLFVTHAIMAPLAAWSCYAGAVDPVALLVALSLLAGVAALQGESSRPLSGVAGLR